MRTLDIFVHPRGNDHWSGRLPEPNAGLTDGPVATVQCASVRARTLRASSEATGAGVRVLLRGGVYEMEKPLMLTGADSGTADAPAVFAAYPGEAPILSGGCRIDGWKTDTVNGRPCWAVDLPAVRTGGWNFTQLFVNGERRFRSRLPKTGYYRFTDIPPAPPGVRWFKGPDVVGFEEGHIQEWRNRDDIRIVILEYWFEAFRRIKSLDLAKRRVGFNCGSIGSLRDERQLPARYFVENVFEALSEPGEFYLDRAAGRLYYLPLPGEDCATAEVIAPRLSELLVLAGCEDAPVRHVRFENIAFRHAEWNYPDDDCGSVQAASKVPGAVVLAWAEECVLYGCEVSHVAHYGIDIRTGSAGNRIVACAIFDLGAGGVRIGHENMERVDETTTAIQPPRRDGRRMATTVCDCEIHHGSRIHYQAVSVLVGNSGGNRIRHNHIHDMNYTGISCGWTWGFGDNATVDNRIEFNHIHHINWERMLSDNGGIYTLGRQPGTTVRGNLIHHIGCYGYGGWGIYLDEGSSEILIDNNCVYVTDDACFFTHYGRDNVARNNIFALAGRNHVNPGSRPQLHRTTLFERNLVYWRTGTFQNSECLWMPSHYLIRNNLLWDGRGGDLDLGRGDTLSDWNAIGQHVGTVVANPLFLDPEAGDFSVRDDSPAASVGFKPFDTRQAGPRLRGDRPASYDGWSADMGDGARPIVHTALEETAAGFRVTVQNLGQAPARGRIRLRCAPAGAVVFAAPPRMEFSDLQPGASRSAEFAVRRRRPLPHATVETVVTGAGLVPTLVFCDWLEWTIATMPSIASVDGVAATLKRAQTLPFLWSRALKVGVMRMALAGDDLAVWMRIDDPVPHRGTSVPAGSCIEFFVATTRDRASAPAADAARLRQVFLVPAADGQPDQIFISAGTSRIDDPRMRMVTKPVAGGYELAALIPLELLQVCATDRELFVEAAARIMHPPAAIPRRASLFNAFSPWSDNTGFERVTIGK